MDMYLCNRKQRQTKKNNIMKSTEYDIQKLAAMISSDSSFTALVEMMGDMGLEITGIEKQC